MVKSKNDTAMVASDIEYALVTHDTYQGICREPPYPECSGICKKLKCHVCICCKGHHHAKNKCQFKTYLMDSHSDFGIPSKTYADAVKLGVSDDASDSERAYVAIEELEEDSAALETAYAVSSLEDETLWIGDTGASVQFKTSPKGMVLEETKQGTAEGAARPLRIEGSGYYPCKQIYKDGSEGVSLRLTKVQVSKTAKVNLFSITQVISQGFKLESEGNGMILTKGDCIIKFDIPYRTKSGVLFCARLQPRNDDTAFDAMDTTPNVIEDDETIEPSKTVPAVVEDTEPEKSKKKVPIAKAHAMFGHQSEKATRRIAKALNIELSRGNLIPCEDCASATGRA